MDNPLSFIVISNDDVDPAALTDRASPDLTEVKFTRVSSLDAAKETLGNDPDLDGVLYCNDLTGSQAADLLCLLAELVSASLPLIILTRRYDIEESISWQNKGAYRYVPADRPELIFGCLRQAASDHRKWAAKKKEEKDLRENEALYRQLVEIYPESIAVTDLEGTFVKVNQETLRFYGFEHPEQMLGKNYLDFVAPEERQKAMENARLTFEKGRSESVLTMLLPNGERSFFEFSTAVMAEESGSAQWFIGAGRDITERIAKDKALEALKDRFSRIFHLSPVATFILALRDYIIIDGNESLLKLVGLQREEIVGRKAADLELPILEYGLSDLIEVAKSKGVVREVERSIPRRGKEKLRVLVSIELIELENEPCALVMLMDITERERAEKEIRRMNDDLELRVAERTEQLEVSNQRLRESEELFRAVFEESPLGIVVSDLKGYALRTNQNLQKLLEYSPEELVTMNFREVSYPDDLESHLELADQLGSGLRDNLMLEKRYVKKSGEVIWVRLHAAVVKKADDQPMFVISMLEDITRQKKAEQELTRALEKEKELNKLKSEFVSRTSHEFRTPLSTILSSAELLEHYGAEWPQQKVILHLNRIQSTALELAEILEDILIVEKVEAGKIKVHLTPVDLKDFFDHMIDEETLRDQHHHTIQLSYHCETSAQALMDQKLLHQIVYNLLSNAIKYSGMGTTIEVDLTCNQGQTRIDIKDYGIGISEEDQDHLFERFYRSDSVSHLPGSGLGLTIVKEAVELLKGSIQVESALGSGSKFSVILPIPKPSSMVEKLIEP